MFKVAHVSNELSTSLIELSKLQEKLSDWQQESEKIQSKFNFYLPDYIVDEIIEKQDSKNFVNLHYLINCAVVNERISESNAKLLKEIYKFK